MPDLFFADGTPVPDEQAQEALAQGAAFARRGAEIPMLDNSGRPVWVPSGELQAAAKQGFRYESAGAAEFRKYQETAGLAEGTKAFAEGAASGLTLGISDPVLQSMRSPEERKEAGFRAEEFSGARGLGEFAGSVGPALVTGGGSVAAQGAVQGAKAALKHGAATALRASPAGLAARGGAALERGATQLLGRAAPKSLAKAGGVAVAGAAEGAAFGAGHALSEAALAPDGDYEGLGEKMMAGAKKGAMFGAILGGGVSAAGQAVGAAARKASSSKAISEFAGELAEDSAVKAIASGKRPMREIRGRESKIGRELLENDIVKGGRSKEAMLEAAEQVRNKKGAEIGDILKEAERRELSQLEALSAGGVKVRAGGKALRDYVGRLQKIADDYRGSGLNKERNALADDLQDRIALMQEAADEGRLSFSKLHELRREIDDSINYAAAEFKPKAEALRDMRRETEDTIESGISRLLSPEELARYKAAKQTYGASAWASKHLFKEVGEGALGRRAISLTDNIWGAGGLAAGAMTGSLGAGAAIAATSAVANNFARKYGRTIVADLAEKVHKLDLDISNKVRRYFRSVGETKAASTGELTRIYLEESGALGAKSGETPAGAYNRVLKRVAQAAEQGPGPMLASVEAPRAAAGAANAVRRGAAFLLAKAPVPPRDLDNPTLARAQGRPPTPNEIRKWSRYAAAVNNPMMVLDALASGALRKEHVEAVKTVYPSLFRAIQRTALEELAATQKEIPRGKRIQLGLLLELPLDPSLDPSHIRITQSVYAADSQAASAPRPGGGGGGERSKNLATRVERIESGELTI